MIIVTKRLLSKSLAVDGQSVVVVTALEDRSGVRVYSYLSGSLRAVTRWSRECLTHEEFVSARMEAVKQVDEIFKTESRTAG